MRAPEFWKTDGICARLLDPIGKIYGLVGEARRRWVTPKQVGIPVICVGNVSVGGAGKTPTAIAIARRLLAKGMCPHFLTRGYGGRERGPLLVDADLHAAAVVGDEPLLLTRVAPTWVSVDRVLGAKAAIEAGASHIIMDDGLQNPYLAKDRSLLVVDGAIGFGNHRLLPAGPLREPIAQALSRVDVVIVIGADQTGVEACLPSGLPRFEADLFPDCDQAAFKGRRILAFAGIGRPEKFYETLGGLGAEIVETRSFPDHHQYDTKEINSLLERSRHFNAACFTTEKDHVRLPLTLGKSVEKLPIRLCFREAEPVDQFLLDVSKIHAAAAK